MSMPPVTQSVKDFVNYFLDTILESRKEELRDQSNGESTGRLIEVVEMSVVLRDLVSPTILPNNDHDDDGN